MTYAALAGCFLLPPLLVLAGLMPLEDLAWPIAAGLLLPALHLLLAPAEDS